METKEKLPSSAKTSSNIPILKKPSTIESSDVESNYTKRSTSSSSAQQQTRIKEKPENVKKQQTNKPCSKTTTMPTTTTTTRTRTSSRNKSPMTHAQHKRHKFGQSKSSSRISTPTTDDNELMKHVSRQGKKFRQHVSVEDLAYTHPNLNPISDIVKDLKLIKRKKDDDEFNRCRAFVVLESDNVKCDRVSTNLYKEQKWMPSWYKPSI